MEVDWGSVDCEPSASTSILLDMNKRTGYVRLHELAQRAY